MVRLGDRLSEERKKQGFSLDEVAKATRIRREFLVAIEKGDYKNLPSSAYIQGFIKNYVNFLGLPEKELLALFRREFNENEFLGVLPESFTHSKKIEVNNLRIKQAVLGAVGLLIVLLVYIFFQYRSAIFSPGLSITYPPDNAIVTTQTISVTGTTDPNATVTVNGLPAFVDSSGNYKKEITVFSGNSTITVKAVNSFGKSSTLVRNIKVKAS